MRQKGQKMTLCLGSCIKDEFGVYEQEVFINGKLYTYPLSSEFIIRKINTLVRRKKFGAAIQLLNKFLITGFNSFKEGN